MLKYMLLLAVTLFLSYGTEIIKVKKDLKCKNVQKDSIEYRICTDTNLSTLDKNLNSIYHDFYLLTPELIQAQKNWLKTRDTCKTNACIQKAYEERIVSLNNALNVQKQFPKIVLDPMILHGRKEWISTIEKEGIAITSECRAFYEDLFLFQNINVVEPTLYKVDYNNTQLKKALGSCWDMRMDYSVYPDRLVKFSLWYSDINHDGKKDLIFGQNNLFDSKGNIYVLDKTLCKNALTKPNFNFEEDRKYISMSYMSGDGNAIVEYEGKGYLLETNIVRNDSSAPIRTNALLMHRRDMSAGTEELRSACTYTEHKKKGEKNGL